MSHDREKEQAARRVARAEARHQQEELARLERETAESVQAITDLFRFLREEARA